LFYYTNRFFVLFLDKLAIKYNLKIKATTLSDYTPIVGYMVVLLTQNTRYTKNNNIKVFEHIVFTLFEVITIKTYTYQ